MLGFVLKQARIIKKGKRHIDVGKDGLIDTLEIPLDGSVKIYAKVSHLYHAYVMYFVSFLEYIYIYIYNNYVRDFVCRVTTAIL